MIQQSKKIQIGGRLHYKPFMDKVRLMKVIKKCDKKVNRELHLRDIFKCCANPNFIISALLRCDKEI